MHEISHGRQLALKVTARRLAFGWTRDELARRSQVAPDTLKRFEQTGQVSLERLLRIAMVLDAMPEFDALFPAIDARSIDELEQLAKARTRKRGKRRVRVRVDAEGADGSA